MEVWQKNTPFVSIPEKNAIPKVYSWLRAQPEPVVIAELPISLFYHGTMMENQLYTSYASLNESGIYAIETYRIYFSTLHKKRMINGYSGFLPDRYNRTSEIL